jgi:hypothetical protein
MPGRARLVIDTRTGRHARSNVCAAAGPFFRLYIRAAEGLHGFPQVTRLAIGDEFTRTAFDLRRGCQRRDFRH